MGRKKKTPVPGCYTANANVGYVSIYRDLLLSNAYMTLTPKQKALYTACVSETHGNATKEHAIATGGTGDTRLFFMNRQLYVDKYGLYAPTDRRGPRRDLAALVDHGLIDCVYQGFAAKEKNTYRLSSRWQDYGKPGYKVPDSVKTLHQQISEGGTSDPTEDGEEN